MPPIFASERAVMQRPAPRRFRGHVEADAVDALQHQADRSPAARALAQLQAMADTIQRQGIEEEEELQMKRRADAAGEAMQRVGEEEEPLQGRSVAASGLPTQLRSGIENLSGRDMSGVRVHYNSDRPGAVQAHAFAQGSDIHVAPGQERHLPHEAWHVVQQAEGRVAATCEVAGQPVNDDAALEREADTMGARAIQEGLQRD